MESEGKRHEEEEGTFQVKKSSIKLVSRIDEFSAIRKNDIKPLTATWIDPEIII